eukprot:COSAG01_NODE_832_length_13250_cov_23.422828_6_plen_91_part_00
MPRQWCRRDGVRLLYMMSYAYSSPFVQSSVASNYIATHTPSCLPSPSSRNRPHPSGVSVATTAPYTSNDGRHTPTIDESPVPVGRAGVAG